MSLLFILFVTVHSLSTFTGAVNLLILILNSVPFDQVFGPSVWRAGGEPDVGGHRVVGVLCAEVGGMNSLEPLMVSAILGLPVVDGDGMGRAFPMLQVCVCVCVCVCVTVCV